MLNEIIKEKEKKISNALNVLKSEFIGIDEQIESVINNMKSWYLFPELQSSPVIVNLWGMTGCGKTSLIKRLVNLLDLEKDLVYFNFAEIGEMTSWEVESNLEDMLGNENTNKIFVYDEFQYAATKTFSGAEKDNKHGLKPFWELLDTGVINRKTQYWRNKTVFEILMSLEIISSYIKPVLQNGIWKNKQECLKSLNKTQIDLIKSKINIEEEKVISEAQDIECSPSIDGCEENEHLLRPYTLNKLTELSEFECLSLEERVLLPSKISNMDFDNLYDYVSRMFKTMRKGHELDYKNSIIFVLGNLDEAYDVSFSVDPDMSPDQFHEITKKISIVDIKKALQSRFRNEQIARLGNIHLIYPSFSSKTFKNIIEINLNKYIKEVKGLTGYDIIFEDTINDIIYKESVFPTHGTRPIFSTIHEMIKSILPNIVLYIHNNNLENIENIHYAYNEETECIVVKFYSNNKEIDSFKKKITLRVDNLRKVEENDKQVIISTHEAGHFITYCALQGKVPEKIRSKTANSSNGGFMLPSIEEDENIQSMQTLKNQLTILVGGYVAEMVIFGKDNITNGASSDLRKATMLASKMVRQWGMGVIPITSTYLLSPEANQIGCDVKFTEEHEFHINIEINKLIEEAIDKAKTILNSEFKHLYIDVVEYLIKNAEIDKKTMQTKLDEFSKKYNVKKYLNVTNFTDIYDIFKSIL